MKPFTAYWKNIGTGPERYWCLRINKPTPDGRTPIKGDSVIVARKDGEKKMNRLGQFVAEDEYGWTFIAYEAR